MVKLFVGNLPPRATEGDLRSLFEKFGKVTECDIIKNYGFVHMKDKKDADEAIKSLNRYKLHGVNINVEASKSKPKTSTKLHVGNVSKSCSVEELQAKFEEYGPVIECDIIKDYAFVHMERSEDAIEAIKGLENTEFKGKKLRVQLSTSRLRTTPGMGDKSGCYRCGKDGHWSKECPLYQDVGTSSMGQSASYSSSSNDRLPTVRPPPYQSVYGDDPFYDERDRLSISDYYERFRVRPYGSAYELYTERRLNPYEVSQSTTLRQLSSNLDLYERRRLPPPVTSSYYERDRSPLRSQSSLSATRENGYVLERTRLSPIPSVSRSSLYDLPRSYLERSWY